MIFAAIDYLQYRLARGPYAPRRLRAQRWRTATPENVADLAPGDVLVIHPRASLLSWLIMYGQNSFPGSHVVILGEHGLIYDTTAIGVHRARLDRYLDGKSWVLPLQAPPEVDREKAISFAESMLGASYGFQTMVRLASDTVMGRKRDALGKTHWRLHSDVVLLLVALTLPRRWWKWWPRRALKAMPVYLITVLVNRLGANAPLKVEVTVEGKAPTANFRKLLFKVGYPDFSTGPAHPPETPISGIPPQS